MEKKVINGLIEPALAASSLSGHNIIDCECKRSAIHHSYSPGGIVRAIPLYSYIGGRYGSR
eukprot:scaffold23518_cov225-Skeletonema_marinoi.AAC.5